MIVATNPHPNPRRHKLIATCVAAKQIASPGSALQQAISNLEEGTYTSDPPYSVVGLPAFLLGPALHLTFERTKLLFSTDATTFQGPRLQYIVNVATDYLGHIDQALAAIGGVTYSDYHQVFIMDPACATFPTQPDVTPSPYTGHVYLGPGDLVWRQDMPTGRNASTDPAPLIAQGNTWRSQYVTAVTGQLATKYNASDQRRADIQSVRAALSNVITTYSTGLRPVRRRAGPSIAGARPAPGSHQDGSQTAAPSTLRQARRRPSCPGRKDGDGPARRHGLTSQGSSHRRR
jgi:hypothetical protein